METTDRMATNQCEQNKLVTGLLFSCDLERPDLKGEGEKTGVNAAAAVTYPFAL